MSAFKCPKCNKTTGGNEIFCSDCGQPLNIECPQCANTWRFMFEYKFCPECGHAMKHVDTTLHVREHHGAHMPSHAAS